MIEIDMDRQTAREIALYEAYLKDSNQTYNSKFGKVRIDREDQVLYLGVTEGSFLAQYSYDPTLPVWLNIMIAEDKFEGDCEIYDPED